MRLAVPKYFINKSWINDKNGLLGPSQLYVILEQLKHEDACNGLKVVKLEKMVVSFMVFNGI